MASVSRFLTNKLKLTVNEAKTRWRDRRSVNSWDLASRMMGASGASRHKLSLPSRLRSSGRDSTVQQSPRSEPSRSLAAIAGRAAALIRE
jgi:hypothetical protein